MIYVVCHIWKSIWEGLCDTFHSGTDIAVYLSVKMCFADNLLQKLNKTLRKIDILKQSQEKLK